MNVVLPFIFVMLIGTMAASQTVSDHALEECQSANESFTVVKDCLPETEVAINLLAATSSPAFFGEAGNAIVNACREHNETSGATWACTKNAISDAVELLEMVGSPEKIKDERFRGIADAESLSRLRAFEAAEQGKFDRLMWGGTMYRPLK